MSAGFSQISGHGLIFGRNYRQALSNLARRYVPRSTYWRDIGKVGGLNALTQAVGVLSTPVITRLYLPADFATFNIFVNCVALMSVVLSMRYEYMVQLPQRDDDANAILALVSVLAVVGCCVFVPLLILFHGPVGRILAYDGPTAGLVLVPIASALICISLTLQHLAQRRREFGLSSTSDLAGKFGYFTAAVGGHLILPGALGLILASALGSVTKCTWLLRVKRSRMRLGNAHAAEPLHMPASALGLPGFRVFAALLHRVSGVFTRYGRLAGALVLSHLMLALTGLLPIVLVGKLYGAATLGQFALVQASIYLPASLIGSAIGQVYFQRATVHWANDEDFYALWRATARKLILLGAPLYLTAALISPWAYPLVFGANWHGAGRIAPFMAVATFFAFISSPMDRSCMVVGAWKYIPLWHFGRLLSTFAVTGFAWTYKWPLNGFLFALAAQMSTMYLVDFFVERGFSRLRRG